MTQSIWIDDYKIEAIKLDKRQMEKYVVGLEFLVTHETYHEITTLLYKNDFLVQLPEENIEFRARISNYSTSITNLYEKGAVGKFKLELTEK